MLAMRIHAYDADGSNRYVLAAWDEAGGEFTSTDFPYRDDVYRATTLRGLVAAGVRSYPTRLAAELATHGIRSPRRFRTLLAEAQRDARDEMDPLSRERFAILLALEPLVARREAEITAMTDGAVEAGEFVTAKPKPHSAVAYITIQADLASRDGPISPTLANLFFQCAQIRGERSVDEWDSLVNAAREADVSIAEALEFKEE